MKDKITGYITGVVNNHIRIVASMKKNDFSRALIQSHQNYTNQLNDLLDYVMDIPEETVIDTYVEINRLRDILAKEEVSSEDMAFEIIILKQRVAELEESCENMSEVERSLQQEIGNLEIDNIGWQAVCNSLRRSNKKLEGKYSNLLRKNKNLLKQLRRLSK